MWRCVCPLFFDDGKVVFDGIEVWGVGGQEEGLMSCLFSHRMDRCLLVEGRVIENAGGLGAQGLEEMLAQPLVEPQSIGAAGKQKRRQEFRAALAGNQASPGPGVAAPLPVDFPAFGSPAILPLGGRGKAGLVQVNDICRALLLDPVAQGPQVRPARFGIPLLVPQRFFYG